MKTFEIDLNEALSALAFDEGFKEAIHSAFEEKYGEDYLRHSINEWEREEAETSSMKLRMEYTIEE